MSVSTVHGRVASRPRLPENGQFLLARSQALASASATGLTLPFGDFSDQCGQFRIMLKGLMAATLLSATATNQWQLQFSTDNGVTFQNANYFNTNDAWYTSSTIGHIVNTTASAMNFNGAATQQWLSATAAGHGVCGIVEMFNATATGRPSLRHYMHGDGATMVQISCNGFCIVNGSGPFNALRFTFGGATDTKISSGIIEVWGQLSVNGPGLQ